MTASVNYEKKQNDKSEDVKAIDDRASVFRYFVFHIWIAVELCTGDFILWT